MKWPFVRRSKYDLLEDGLNIVKENHDRFLVEINRLNQDLSKEINSHRETKEVLNAYKKALTERAEEYEKLLSNFRKTSAIFKQVKNEIIISLKKLY